MSFENATAVAFYRLWGLRSLSAPTFSHTLSLVPGPIYTPVLFTVAHRGCFSSRCLKIACYKICGEMENVHLSLAERQRGHAVYPWARALMLHMHCIHTKQFLAHSNIPTFYFTAEYQGTGPDVAYAPKLFRLLRCIHTKQPGLENRNYGRGDPLRWPRDTLIS
jgi:hypothetical protein